MTISEIVKKLDEADAAIRERLKSGERLKSAAIPIGERRALEEARDWLQMALTPLLKYQ